MFPEPLTSWWLLQRARASSHRLPQWFHRRQEATLRRLLVHAYGNVPLYRQLYDEAGFRPEMFRTLDDLARIPPLTKATLKSARDGEAMAQGVNRATCTVATTSGSTGMPMRIVMGPYERSWNRAVAWRILFEHSFRWTDRSLEIRMRHQRPHPLQRLGLAPKDWASILADPAEWARLLERQRYGFLLAGAGTLELLAQAVAGQPVRPPRVLISDSEPLTPRARALIRDALGSDPVDVYGLEEVSNFAWECERHAGLHVSADSHLVEVDASPGNTGPLRVTALGMWTMPIIRYETGDLAAWATEPCRCGRTPGLIQSLSQGLLPGLSAWAEVGGIASSLCWKAPPLQPIST